MLIPVGQIIPDPNQPRKTFDDEAIKELASSFANYGVISPLKVRSYGDNQYMIIVGEMRYRASKLRGEKEIECVVQEATDQQVREMQFIENLQREDVPDLELGRAFHDYCQTYKETQTTLASRLGKEKHYVGDRIAVATKLSGDLVPTIGKPGGLAYTEARDIATIPEHKRQVEVAQPFMKGEVSSTHIQKVAEIARKEPERPVEDIIEEVTKGKVQEKEAARVEAAKRALEMPLETPEDLERAAEALKKEAQRKAKEAMTPEEKAALEAENKAKLEAQAATRAEREEEKRQQKAEEERRRQERAERKARAELKEDKAFVQEALRAMPEEERIEVLGLVPVPTKPKEPKSVNEQFQEVIKEASQLVTRIEKLRADPGFHELDLKPFALDIYMLADAFTELSEKVGGSHGEKKSSS